MFFRLVALNCRYTHSCLALYYLRTILAERFGADCRIEIEQRTINDPYYETLLAVLADRPDILFFSVSIWNAVYVKRLINDLRQVLPDLPVVVGGPQISHGDEHELAGLCTLVKGAVEGLGDDFFNDLASGLLQPSYTAGAYGTYPFPYRLEDFATTLANRSVYYEASRGCPFSCTYCLSSVEKGVLVKDLAAVKGELTELLGRRPKTLRFVDRTFNTSPERTLAIWQLLLDYPGDTVFHFEMAPDRFTSEMLSFLQTVPPGRFRFEIGLQSTNPGSLREIRRGMDLTLALANIERLAAMDRIHLHVDLILGLPHETDDSFLASFDAVFALQPHYIQMGLLKLLPGTAMAENRDSYGMRTCAAPPYELLASRWLDATRLGRLYLFGECVEAMYNNRFFRSFWSYLNRHEANASDFFMEILDISQRSEFAGRAKNQELLSKILFRFAKKRDEREVLSDILRHDWLSCGHRFLPDHLNRTEDRDLRRIVSLRLPQNLPPIFSYRSRAEFIKRCMFLQMCPASRRHLNLPEDEEGCLCFLAARDSGIFSLQRTIWLPFF